jgi:nitroreductase
METWEAIRSRRDVRSFQDKPIARDHLDEILESGRRTPSARNRQPWDFVVVTDRDQLARLTQAGPGAGYLAGAAAAVALVAPLPGEGRQRDRLYYDLGQVTMSMMLAAAGLGIGSGHVGISDDALAREVLGLPPDKFCAFMITFGYPADRPLSVIRHPDRRPFDEVVHRGRW